LLKKLFYDTNFIQSPLYKMSFNPLNTSSPTGVIDLTLSPPSSPVASTRRAPRRCSCCRQTGHNIRNCPDAAAVHYRGQTYNVYPHPRDNLIQFVYTYCIERVSGLDENTLLSQGLYEKIYFHVNGMTYRELTTALRNPLPTITYSHEQLLLLIENYRILQISRRRVPLLGRDYAKKIVIDLTPSRENAEECFICCDNKCSLKTSCGHEYCDDCISSILFENKNKTSHPLCSFCKTPFSKFIVTDTFVFSTLTEFIQKLS
jgi:hypothetical protein